MGWLRWNGNREPVAIPNNSSSELISLQTADNGASKNERLKHVAASIEPTKREYACQPIDLSDDELPFIPSDIVQASKSDSKTLWIVIDRVVFDCTEFVSIHPGGHTVIESFSGEDCSWQFWRFHSQSIMDGEGRHLRVGRTADIMNRFKEKPRFIGLRRLGADEGW